MAKEVLYDKNQVEKNAFDESRPLLTIRELGALLGVSTATINRWNRAGKIPAPIAIGGSIRWKRTVVNQFIESLGDDQ